MTQPRINWQGDKLYFHDAEGGVWRVYDCIEVSQRSRAIPLSDPRAMQREFVNRDGSRRVLRFAADTPRSISPKRLDEQLRAALDAAPASDATSTSLDTPDRRASNS